MTSLATPRASTACPPGRSPGDCSTTVTSAPRRCSQWASAGPAILAPDTNTLTLLIVSPSRPSDDGLASLWAARPAASPRFVDRPTPKSTPIEDGDVMLI